MEIEKKPFALIVDDDKFFLDIFARILGKLGFEMESSASEPEFIQKIKARIPDICFVDININGLESGFALVRSIRGKFGPEIPIFVVSGKSDPKAIAHAMESGATDFIMKPIDKEVLASKLARFFDVDKVREDELSYIRAPDEGFSAELTLPLCMTDIDEIGATFHCQHLIPKGTTFFAHGEVISSAFGKDKQQLMTVVTTEVSLKATGFTIYAEFDDPSEKELANVRRWIRNHRQGGDDS